jgi:hypothetical protein
VVSLEFHFELGKAIKIPLQYEVHFQKCGIFYCVKSSFPNEDYERLEYHFEKWLEDFVTNTSKIIILFQFSYKFHILGELNPSPSPNFWISYFPVLTHVC